MGTQLTMKLTGSLMKKLSDAFPALQASFFEILKERIEENGFTDYSLEKTVNHIIDTFQYSEPKIADFIQYGKNIPKNKPDQGNPYKVREDWVEDPYLYKSNADK